MKAAIIGGILLALSIEGAAAKTFKVVVSSGYSKSLAVYRSWKRNCEPYVGIVEMVRKPANGKASAKKVASVIPKSRYSDVPNNCEGRPIPGLNIEYESLPGFRGTDTFTVKVTHGNRKPEIDTFQIVVE